MPNFPKCCDRFQESCTLNNFEVCLEPIWEAILGSQGLIWHSTSTFIHFCIQELFTLTKLEKKNSKTLNETCVPLFQIKI